MKEKRSIITMDGQGNIALPTDTGSIAMTEWELCELFGVIAPTIRAGISLSVKTEFEGTRDKAYHPPVGQP